MSGRRPMAARLWTATVVEQLAEWAVLFALAVYPASRGDYSITAAVVASRFGPALVIYWLLTADNRARLARVPVAAYTALLAAMALMVWFLAASGSLSDAVAVGPLLGAAVVLGLFSALAALARRASLQANFDLSQLGSAAGADALAGRAALAIAPIPAGVLALISPPATALVGAALFVVVLLVGRDPRVAGQVRPADTPKPGPSILVVRQLWVHWAAVLASGALAGALLSLLFAGPGPALLALFGVGLLLGRLPMPRVLLRISAPILVLGTAVVETLVMVVVLAMGQPWYGQPAWLLIVAFLILGFSAASQDAVRRIAVRRLAGGSHYEDAALADRRLLVLGQVLGAAAVVLGAQSPGPAGTVIGVAVVQLLLVAVAFAAGGLRANLQVGSLSSLPVKSVVHKLSWATDPPARPAFFVSAGARPTRLARWVERRVALERLDVTLPISGRRYEIVRPTDASREKLFEAGRADPDKQMPYWAKVWPSGVALADVVVERADQVKGAHILELGAGLGVTACAVVEAGGRLMTADYSALPLAICRLNALVNGGQAPRATCFNWRYPPEVEAAMAQPDFEGGFPLILAADVLYEGRDAIPLLNVIERLLTPDGELWLAEPVRRTAQRFLDAAADLGWDIDSRQVQADWPDATSGPVNLHLLKRSAQPDAVVGDLGGWRI